MMSDSRLQNTQPKACVFIFALCGIKWLHTEEAAILVCYYVVNCPFP